MPNRNSTVPHDTEDKQWWLIHGERLEHEFVKLCQDHLKIDISINPEKKKDPTSPDLLFKGRLADLKSQKTPFFTSMKYQLDPRYTVTFNRKDYLRYKSLYPDIQLFFWVDWQQLSLYNIEIDYLGGIYTVPFNKICQLIDDGAPEHAYGRRKNDTRGNAKSSFLFDIRNFTEIFSSNKQR